MDTYTDADAFRRLMDQLCSVWDRPPAKDEQIQAYWYALRDVRFSEVRTNAERIMRTASGKQTFPKPGDLRNEPRREGTPGADGAFAEAERQAIIHLEELRRTSPTHWLEIMRPKCHEIGRKRGMTEEAIEAKLRAAVECAGPVTR